MKEIESMMEKRQVSDAGGWAACLPAETRQHGAVEAWPQHFQVRSPSPVEST